METHEEKELGKAIDRLYKIYNQVAELVGKLEELLEEEEEEETEDDE